MTSNDTLRIAFSHLHELSEAELTQDLRTAAHELAREGNVEELLLLNRFRKLLYILKDLTDGVLKMQKHHQQGHRVSKDWICDRLAFVSQWSDRLYWLHNEPEWKTWATTILTKMLIER